MGGSTKRSFAAVAAAVLAVSVTSPAWSGSSHPGGNSVSGGTSDSGMVLLHLCNKTDTKIYVALSYRASVDSDDWVVEGWKNISASSCFDISVPNDSVVYDYAEDDYDHYWGGDFMLCVEHPGPFHRINTSNYTCSSDELKGFNTDDVEGRSEATVNFNP